MFLLACQRLDIWTCEMHLHSCLLKRGHRYSIRKLPQFKMSLEIPISLISSFLSIFLHPASFPFSFTLTSNGISRTLSRFPNHLSLKSHHWEVLNISYLYGTFSSASLTIKHFFKKTQVKWDMKMNL